MGGPPEEAQQAAEEALERMLNSMTDPDAAEPEAQQQQQAAPKGEGLTLGDVLGMIDPRDSESATQLLTWLQQTGRLQKIGHLDGVGYTFIYREPKGSTRAGWTAGGTQGDRIVDDALEKAQADGNKPVQRGLCRKCFSVLAKVEGEDARLEDVEEGDPTACSAGGKHDFAS